MSNGENEGKVEKFSNDSGLVQGEVSKWKGKTHVSLNIDYKEYDEDEFKSIFKLIKQ